MTEQLSDAKLLQLFTQGHHRTITIEDEDEAVTYSISSGERPIHFIGRVRESESARQASKVAKAKREEADRLAALERANPQPSTGGGPGCAEIVQGSEADTASLLKARLEFLKSEIDKKREEAERAKEYMDQVNKLLKNFTDEWTITNILLDAYNEKKNSAASTPEIPQTVG